MRISGNPANQRRALDEINAMQSTPASPVELVDALAGLSALCARKSDGDDVNAATLQAYTRKLESYPRSAALKAIDAWSDRSKWFPTWFELMEVCEQFMGPRRAVVFALGKVPEADGAPAEPIKTAASKKGFAGLGDVLRAMPEAEKACDRARPTAACPPNLKKGKAEK